MIFYPTDIKLVMKKAQIWASSFSTICIFDSNGFVDKYSAFSMAIAVDVQDSFRSDGVDSLKKLQIFLNQHRGNFIGGYLGYDLIDEIAVLNTNKQNKPNFYQLNFPTSYFFIPKTLILFRNKEVEIISDDPNLTLQSILKVKEHKENKSFTTEIKPRISREQYGTAFRQVQNHIKRGNVYELNLCQEFYVENIEINPFSVYLQLNSLSPNPFSCFFKNEKHVIICASPERFIGKRDSHLFSQPIKGTAPRGKSIEEDKINKEALQKNPKDITENIMIVDLVRNDLTRVAEKGSVKVDELLGIYSFPQVHQLISTISCTVNAQTEFSEIINSSFPPGSMTGAPKISAMQVIEDVEKSARGVYSGSLGYFSASGDFDFNVIIRSILYNQETNYLSYQVGGAITALSIEEDEYQECLLKAKAIVKCLVN